MDQDNVIFIRENCSVEYGDSDGWCERGIALLNLERNEEALQAAEKTLELNPNTRCLVSKRHSIR